MTTTYDYIGKACECCGRRDEYEIGTSALGWQFMFNWRDGLETYRDWIALLESGGTIRDEYGETSTVDEFKEMVESKQGGLNHAVRYPDYNYTDPDGYTFVGAWKRDGGKIALCYYVAPP